MDVLSSNSGNTFDKKLNISINFYSTFNKETVFVNYGDQKNESINMTTSNYNF
jgi:hypothetical protein